ncbi:winged helix-turn-helix domain-containing protein [Enterococcus sp. LJL99]
MSDLGILADEQMFPTELFTVLQSQTYQLIDVKEKEQFERLDGLIIYLTNEKSLPEAIDWLIFSKSKSDVFVWIISQNLLDREQTILFELGANDVLCVSDGIEKLPYIIKNTFDRTNQKKKETDSMFPYSFLNDKNQTVVVNGQEVGLTRTEFQFLRVLFERVNTTVTYEEVFRTIWPDSPDVQTLRIANVVFHLREKIKESKDFSIKTTRSIGYLLRIEK